MKKDKNKEEMVFQMVYSKFIKLEVPVHKPLIQRFVVAFKAIVYGKIDVMFEEAMFTKKALKKLIK